MAAIRLVNAVGNNTNNDLVGNQAAFLHDGFRLEAGRCAGLDGGTQHIAGGKLYDAVLFPRDVPIGCPCRRLAWPKQKTIFICVSCPLLCRLSPCRDHLRSFS